MNKDIKDITYMICLVSLKNNEIKEIKLIKINCKYGLSGTSFAQEKIASDRH